MIIISLLKEENDQVEPQVLDLKMVVIKMAKA